MACYQWQNNGSCKFGENCRFSHGADGEDAYGAGAGAPRPQWTGGARSGGGRSRGVCYNFQENGACDYGDRCRFAHGEEDERKAGGFGGGYAGFRSAPRSRGTCFTFRDSGSCNYGDECRFSHDLSGGADGGAKAQSGICYKFRDEGFCSFGDDCRFSHEAEVAPAAVLEPEAAVAEEAPAPVAAE